MCPSRPRPSIRRTSAPNSPGKPRIAVPAPFMVHAPVPGAGARRSRARSAAADPRRGLLRPRPAGALRCLSGRRGTAGAQETCRASQQRGRRPLARPGERRRRPHRQDRARRSAAVGQRRSLPEGRGHDHRDTERERASPRRAAPPARSTILASGQRFRPRPQARQTSAGEAFRGFAGRGRCARATGRCGASRARQGHAGGSRRDAGARRAERGRRAAGRQDAEPAGRHQRWARQGRTLSESRISGQVLLPLAGTTDAQPGSWQVVTYVVPGEQSPPRAMPRWRSSSASRARAAFSATSTGCSSPRATAASRSLPASAAPSSARR